MAAKQVALVRTDGLFSLTVAVTALLAFRAWQTGRGWTWCWLAAAAATLTKGPLGPLLAGLGLLAALWERRTGRPAGLRGSHWAGVLLFVAIAGGWFALAFLEAGHALSDRMLVRELYGRAISKGEGSAMGQGFYLPTMYFLARYAPWSFVTCVALWRAWRRPAKDDIERRCERFLVCWFVPGLAVFSLAAHQRPDLIFPLIPAAALLAGRELARWLEKWPERKLVVSGAALVAVGILAVDLYYGRLRSSNEAVAQTRATEQLAAAILQRVGPEFPLVHVDSSPVLQMHLGTANPLVSEERALRLLASPAAAFVAVKNAGAVLERLPNRTIQVVAAAPPTRRTHMAVLSNRAVLDWHDPIATIIGPLRLEMTGVKHLCRRGRDFCLEAESDAARVELINESEQPVTVQVRFSGRFVRTEIVTVPPGGSRTVTGH